MLIYNREELKLIELVEVIHQEEVDIIHQQRQVMYQ